MTALDVRAPDATRHRRATRLARLLHPGAWWLWAAGLAVAASRTTNPLLLLLIVAVAGYVVAARRSPSPWARSFAVFLKLGLIVIAIRVVFQAIVAAPIGTTVIFTLPALTLPEIMAGVRLGGPVTLESMVAALYDGMRLATILICVGAANSLASPARLLQAVPAALYERLVGDPGGRVALWIWALGAVALMLLGLGWRFGHMPLPEAG